MAQQERKGKFKSMNSFLFNYFWSITWVNLKMYWVWEYNFIFLFVIFGGHISSKDSPLRRAADGHLRKVDKHGKVPQRHYYKSPESAKTYYITPEGHLQCRQYPLETIKASSINKLLGSRATSYLSWTRLSYYQQCGELLWQVGKSEGRIWQGWPISATSRTCKENGYYQVKRCQWHKAELLGEARDHHTTDWAYTVGLFSNVSLQAQWWSSSMFGSKVFKSGYHP